MALKINHNILKKKTSPAILHREVFLNYYNVTVRLPEASFPTVDNSKLFGYGVEIVTLWDFQSTLHPFHAI